MIIDYKHCYHCLQPMFKSCKSGCQKLPILLIQASLNRFFTEAGHSWLSGINFSRQKNYGKSCLTIIMENLLEIHNVCTLLKKWGHQLHPVSNLNKTF